MSSGVDTSHVQGSGHQPCPGVSTPAMHIGHESSGFSAMLIVWPGLYVGPLTIDMYPQ
jgi:hypothetical protein